MLDQRRSRWPNIEPTLGQRRSCLLGIFLRAQAAQTRKCWVALGVNLAGTRSTLSARTATWVWTEWSRVWAEWSLFFFTHSGNTKRWPDVGLMLVHRLRRWPNIKPTSGERLVSVVQSFARWVSVFCKWLPNPSECGPAQPVRPASTTRNIINYWLTKLYWKVNWMKKACRFVDPYHRLSIYAFLVIWVYASYTSQDIKTDPTIRALLNDVGPEAQNICITFVQSWPKRLRRRYNIVKMLQMFCVCWGCNLCHADLFLYLFKKKWNHHNCLLSQLFSVHLNTYVMGLWPS